MCTKKIICLCMAILIILPTIWVNTAAEDYTITQNGLVAWYDGEKNTVNGHDPNATVWEDLKGDYDVTVAKTATNYFTDKAFHLSNASYNFPSALLDLVNGQEFTVEMKLGKIEKTGSSYTTMINNSGNDNFSLFIRTAGDYLEFKSSNNNRPKYTGGKDYFEDSTVAVVFSMATKSCAVYVDGMFLGSVSISKTIGATGTFFFGHSGSTKAHTADYEGFRFYNRALSAEEVAINAKADGNYDLSYIPPREFVNVRQNKTNIAGDIAFVEEILTMEQAQAFLQRDVMPAVAIIHVNEKLLLTNNNGEGLGGSLAELMSLTDNTVIPAYYVKNEATVTALTKYLESELYEDFYIISDQPALIKKVHEQLPIARGIIDLTDKYAEKIDLTEDDLVEIRKTVFSNDCKVAILPQSVCNKDDIGTLCKWQVTPWVKAKAGLVSKVDALTLLLSSAYGIVSDNTELLSKTATSTLVTGTLARTPVIIGHRGLGGIKDDAPENTLKSAILAYNAGANAIEFDVYLSRDGKVVANHNATTTNMATVSGDKPVNANIETSTYTDLQKYYYTGYYLKDENGQFILDENGEKQIDKTIKIDLLEDYLKYFKDKDVQLVIEIKSTKEEKIVAPIKELIDKYDMYDQVNIIAFGRTNAYQALRELYPEMNIGFLTDTANANADSNEAMRDVLEQIQEYCMTYNPTKQGYEAAFVRAATYRGITTWPWTFYNDSAIYKYITYGHAGITTDYSTMIADFIRDISATSPESVGFGDNFEISVEKLSYGREKITGLDANTEIIPVGGEHLIDKIEGNKVYLVPEEKGEISYIVRYTQIMNKDYSYTIYTQPITVQVGDPPVPTEVVEVVGYRGYVKEDTIDFYISFTEDALGKEVSITVGEKSYKATVMSEGAMISLAKTDLDEKITVKYGGETILEYSLRNYLTAVSTLDRATEKEKAVANALLKGEDHIKYFTTVKKEEE